MACSRCGCAACAGGGDARRPSYGRRLERRGDVRRFFSLPAVRGVAAQRDVRGDLLEELERVVALEWEQFDAVLGMNGRAGCQDDLRRFSAYRCAQYLAFPHGLIPRVLAELEQAELGGRNLVEEKYARMMAATDPAEFNRTWANALPLTSPVKRGALAQLRELLAPALAQAARDLPQAHRHARPDVSSAGMVSALDYFLAELEGYSLSTIFYLRDALARAGGGGNPIEMSYVLAARLLEATEVGA